MKEKILFKNKWIDVLELDNWYTVYRLGKTNQGVHILVYRVDIDGYIDVLVRKENCLPHGGYIDTSVTGTVEEGDSPLYTAKKELLEETGYDRPEEKFMDLGYIYPSKASDFRLYLYAIDVGFGRPESLIMGDGTIGEKGASTYWTAAHEAINIPSAPAIAASLMKLLARLG